MEEKFIAMRLAHQGVDAVKNIRDTNYLNFAADPDECWNTLNASSVTDCATSNKITDGVTYYLSRNFDSSAGPLFKWTLSEYNASDDTANGSLTLYSYALDDGGSTLKYAESGRTESFLTAVDEEAFVRTLSFEYDGEDAFEVSVTVEWTVNDQTKSLTLRKQLENIF